MDLPNLQTIEDILKNYIYIDDGKESNLDDSQINKLLKLSNNDEPLLNLDDRFSLQDILGLISELGFDEAYKFFKNNRDIEPRMLIFDSKPFNYSKKTNYNDLIGDLIEGKVILYADNITGSMQYAIDETDRRRKKQMSYNLKNNITPKTVISKISDILADLSDNADDKDTKDTKNTGNNLKESIQDLQNDMAKAASNLEFEEAARIRDEIKKLQQKELGLMAIPNTNFKTSSYYKKK